MVVVWMMACGAVVGPAGELGDTGQPRLVAAPEVLDFGAWEVGDAAIRSVALHNLGEDDLELDLWLTPAAFQLVDPPPRPLRLAPGASLTVAVQFLPTDPLHDDLLVVRSRERPDGLIGVPLTGRGRDALTR